MAKKSPHIHVYGICGYKGSGKDTLAKMIVEFNANFTILHFADDLKSFASEIFKIDEKFFHDPDLKEVKIDDVVMDEFIHKMSLVTGLVILPRGKVARTPREVLQYFGTEYVRSVDDLYWVNRVVGKIKRIGRKILVPDVRFMNEVDAIRKCGGTIIKMSRIHQSRGSDHHASESFVEKIYPDIEIASVENNLSIPKAFAYNVSIGRSKILSQFDYRLFERCKNLYLSGKTFSEVGEIIGIKGMAKKGARGIIRKLFDYYSVKIRGNGLLQRKQHRFIVGIECKHCSRCDGWKNIEEFNYSSSSWDDLFSICRKCQSSYNKKRFLESKSNLEKIFKTSKKNSLYSKKEFSISFEYAKNLWDSALGKCAYTGLPMTFSNKDPMRATIDRIDSSVGYVEGNIVWCSYRANIMKGNSSVEEFRNLVGVLNSHMSSTVDK